MEMKKENILSKNIRKVAFGLSSGVVLGTASSFIVLDDTTEHPELVDGDVSFAGSMSGDMSFEEAFNTAREEIGPRGAFEWQGNIFSTYTEAEWDSLSEEEKSEYFNNFRWDAESMIDDRIEQLSN